MYHNLPTIEKYYLAKLQDILESPGGLNAILLTFNVLRQISDLIKESRLYSPLLRKNFVTQNGILIKTSKAVWGYDMENIHSNLLVGNNLNKPFVTAKPYCLGAESGKVIENPDGDEYTTINPLEVVKTAYLTTQRFFESLKEEENTVAYLFALARFNSCVPSDLESLVPNL